MSKKRYKISIIGAGNIGGTLGFALSQQNNFDILLYDKNFNLAKGKSLDIEHSINISQSNSTIKCSNNYSDLENSDVVVISAGVARKPGMDRLDLLKVNAEVIIDIAENLKKLNSLGLVIIVTNPLDTMSYLFQKISGFDPNTVVGMAGILDSARFSAILSKETDLDPMQIKPVILGNHGNELVVVPEHTLVKNNLTLEDAVKLGLVSQEKIDHIIEKTKSSGGEIVELLGQGSAFYAPSLAVVKIINNYLFDLNEIILCSVKLKGEYGVKDIYFGAPIILSSKGIKVLELELSENTINLMNKSRQVLEKAIEEMTNLLN